MLRAGHRLTSRSLQRLLLARSVVSCLPLKPVSAFWIFAAQVFFCSCGAVVHDAFESRPSPSRGLSSVAFPDLSVCYLQELDGLTGSATEAARSVLGSSSRCVVAEAVTVEQHAQLYRLANDCLVLRLKPDSSSSELCPVVAGVGLLQMRSLQKAQRSLPRRARPLLRQLRVRRAH